MNNNNERSTIQVSIRLTEEWASKLDDILQKAFDNKGIASFDIQDDKDMAIYEAAFEQLEELHFGRALTEDEFQIYSNAIPFLLTGGFTASYRTKKEEEDRKRKLTSYQIRAAKREPYFRLWSIITTISTLILGWLQFFK